MILEIVEKNELSKSSAHTPHTTHHNTTQQKNTLIEREHKRVRE